MSHRFGNCLWDVVEVGESFRVMMMVIPSQALKDFFQGRCREWCGYYLSSFVEYGKGAFQPTNNLIRLAVKTEVRTISVRLRFDSSLDYHFYNVLLSSNGRKADLYPVSPRLGRNIGSNPIGSTNKFKDTNSKSVILEKVV